MKELAIGEEIRIRCVKGIAYCKECAFFMIQDKPHCMNVCNPNFRTDREKIHFEIIDDVPEIHSGNINPIDLPTDEEICTCSSMYYTGSAVHYVREGMRIMKKMIEEKLKDKDNGSN